MTEAGLTTLLPATDNPFDLGAANRRRIREAITPDLRHALTQAYRLVHPELGVEHHLAFEASSAGSWLLVCAQALIFLQSPEDAAEIEAFVSAQIASCRDFWRERNAAAIATARKPPTPANADKAAATAALLAKLGATKP